eukprot:CAMPEP_0206492618 /NCGR_PEP_ID=MMETSP0324_2-20121206/46250_1 /ASSEMBLY_ACC=CAM_ASM_000836 /TAXON_ID=2866 /ORGANISM="Crypthecodinium cohnii, Strain Seligo" /LENGTH=50 /DNA_ID=CAMNT_0053975137 /DNA_START=51 /DNA_END=200 /DNA_ORIENTATION=+
MVGAETRRVHEAWAKQAPNIVNQFETDPGAFLQEPPQVSVSAIAQAVEYE